MKKILIPLGLAALMLAGCGKKDEAEQATPPPANQPTGSSSAGAPATSAPSTSSTTTTSGSVTTTPTDQAQPAQPEATEQTPPPSD